jgi:hypothetical protein
MEDVSKIRLLVFITIGYGIFFVVNNFLSQSLYLLPGAHIVHLPSGAKLFIVLVAGIIGATAISIVGVAYGAFVMFKDNYLLVGCLGVATFVTPILSIKVARNIQAFEDDLNGLTSLNLLHLSIAYAVINSILHQIPIYFLTEQPDFINGTLVMLTGDITGVFLLLYIARTVLKVLRATGKM